MKRKFLFLFLAIIGIVAIIFIVIYFSKKIIQTKIQLIFYHWIRNYLSISMILLKKLIL